MKIPKPFRTLKFQIVAYYFLASLLIVSIFGVIIYSSLTGVFLKDALTATTESVEQNGRAIENYLAKLEALSELISNDIDTILYLQTGNNDAMSRINTRLNAILESDDSLVSAALVSKKGDILSNKNNFEAVISKDMMEEAWYVDVMMSKGMPVLTSIRRQAFTMDKSTWVISVGQEIVDDNGAHLGVFILDFSYEIIDRQLSNLNLGENGSVFILTNDYQVVYHKDPAYFEDVALQEELIKICNMQTGYDKDLNILTHHYELKNSNWLLVGLSSLDNLNIARRQIFETIILVGVVLLFIALGSGFIIAIFITRPIASLEKAMQNLTSDLSTVVEMPIGCYEVEQLKNHFNEMASKIRTLMDNIKEKESYLRESEIKRLFSQINPHFLYNTLDTIVWMAEFGDSDKVIAVTKALAQFFRISLNNGKEMIPLEQELEHVLQYLFIQKERYDDKLNYEILCSEELKDIEVPKIILQPLVENAIYHGIKPMDGIGHIKIAAYVDSEKHYLYLEVTDNGVGMNESNVQSGTKLGGVGMDNVRRRLSLLYNEADPLKVISEPLKGTTVTIRIPYQ